MISVLDKRSQRRMREIDLERAKEAQERREDQKNSKFTQVSPKGWERIRELSKDKQGVAAIALYSFLAEHIDPTCGAVVAEQQFLADKLNVSRSTIKRWLNYLEAKNAVVRIPVAGNFCSYSLDPHEEWKGYNSSKGYAAFVSKTLVNVDGDVQRRIVAMFKGQEGDAKDQCDLPLE